MQVVPLSMSLHHHVNRGHPEADYSGEDDDVVEKVIRVETLL